MRTTSISRPSHRCVAALFILAIIGRGFATETAPSYPNELPGYRFYSTAKWSALRPLVSTMKEANDLLGVPSAVFYDAGPRWKFIIYYWGEGGTCDGQPYPDALIGTIARIEVVPKGRESFGGVEFPSAFRKTDEHSSHDPVGSWNVYEDAFGLKYKVYATESSDGTIHAGDLKAIVYGPSRELYLKLTGCRVGGEQ